MHRVAHTLGCRYRRPRHDLTHRQDVEDEPVVAALDSGGNHKSHALGEQWLGLAFLAPRVA